MTLQFQCPFCHQVLALPPSGSQMQVQCPFCRQTFLVDASVHAIPVVQAHPVTVAPPQAAQPPQPNRAPPPAGRPVGPPAGPQRAPRPRSPTAPIPEESGGKVKLVIGVAILLGFGAAWWALDVMSKKAKENDAYAVFVTASKQTAPAQEAWRKEQQAEKDRIRKGKEVFREYFAKVLTRGDEKMAEQLVQLILSVDDEHEKLCTDADRDNDPKDYEAFFKDRLRVLAAENKTVHHWLGGKSPDIIHEAVFGRPQEPQRGETAEFLREEGYRGNGTGFCVSPDGWIITNEHVVDDASSVDVRGADGRILQAEVVEIDAERDLALLRIQEKPVAWLAVDSAPLAMGDSVFTIGFPRATQQGVEPKFIDGRVSSLTGYRDEKDRYQTTVPVGPGNSGGALVNAKNGSVAGVIVARLNGDNVSYAVKSAELTALLKKVTGVTAPPPASGESALIERTRQATYLVLVK